MYGVHFKIVKLTIDGMLRLSVEMELSCVIFLWSTINLLSDIRGESHWSSDFILEIDLHGVSVEFWFSLEWVLVDFCELIS